MTASFHLVLVDDSGQEISRHEIAVTADPSGARAAEPPELPITLDWYRDAARWWTTAAAALLVFGVAYLPQGGSSYQFWLFAVAALLLGVAVLLGLLNYVSIIEMGMSWLNLNVLAIEEPGPERDASWKTEKDLFDKYQDRLGWTYSALIWLFAAGAIGLTLSIAISAMDAEVVPREYAVVSGTAEQLMLFDRSTGASWQLATDADGAMAWQRIAPAVVEPPASD